MADKPIVFGLLKYQGVVAGVHLQSVTYGETCSTAEAMAENGSIEQIDVYGRKRTIQCQGNVTKANEFNLTVGAELKVGDDVYTIDSISITETVNGHKTAQISGSAPMPETVEDGSGS